MQAKTSEKPRTIKVKKVRSEQEDPKNQARALAKNLRVSPRKLNLVAQSIRGLDCEKALKELLFSRKRIAHDVKKVLESAISNAENNHNLDIDKLYVSEAYVGKGLVMKRWNPRAKGRGVRILKPYSHLTMIVCERKENAQGENI